MRRLLGAANSREELEDEVPIIIQTRTLPSCRTVAAPAAENQQVAALPDRAEPPKTCATGWQTPSASRYKRRKHEHKVLKAQIKAKEPVQPFLVHNTLARPTAAANATGSSTAQQPCKASVDSGAELPQPLTSRGVAIPHKVPFAIFTWNVRGLTTVAHDLRLSLHSEQPEVVVLTETKLVRGRHNKGMIKRVFQDSENNCMYDWYCSSHDAPFDKWRLCHARNGSGGVVVAVHKRWLPESTVRVKPHFDLPYLVSHAVGVTIHTPHGQALDVYGIYMPFRASHRQGADLSAPADDSTNQTHGMGRRLECGPIQAPKAYRQTPHFGCSASQVHSCRL